MGVCYIDQVASNPSSGRGSLEHYKIRFMGRTRQHRGLGDCVRRRKMSVRVVQTYKYLHRVAVYVEYFEL